MTSPPSPPLARLLERYPKEDVEAVLTMVLLPQVSAGRTANLSTVERNRVNAFFARFKLSAQATEADIRTAVEQHFKANPLNAALMADLKVFFQTAKSDAARKQVEAQGAQLKRFAGTRSSVSPEVLAHQARRFEEDKSSNAVRNLR
jgi:hypothetical protein